MTLVNKLKTLPFQPQEIFISRLFFTRTQNSLFENVFTINKNKDIQGYSNRCTASYWSGGGYFPSLAATGGAQSAVTHPGLAPQNRSSRETCRNWSLAKGY